MRNKKINNSQAILIKDIEKKLGNQNIPKMDEWNVY